MDGGDVKESMSCLGIGDGVGQGRAGHCRVKVGGNGASLLPSPSQSLLSAQRGKMRGCKMR